jgi:hypothetical protein
MFYETTNSNIFLGEEQKKEFVDLFNRVQFVYFALTKFVNIIKFKKARIVADEDLCLNKLDINSEREIEYLFTPMRFKEGIFMMECTECAAHYMASKSQGLCKDCCDMYGTAKILSSKNDTNAKGKTKKLIFTTEKTLTIAQAKELAYHAFNTGRLSTIDYDSWILTQNL